MAGPTTTRHRESTRIVLRPIGSALPIGLFALAIGSTLVGCLALGIIPVSETGQVGQAVATFAFPLELIAMLVAFLARDTMSATVFGLFSASWLTTGLAMIQAEPGALSATSGIFAIMLSICICLLAVLALKAKPYIGILLGLSAGRLAAHGVYELSGAQGWHNVSGYFAAGVVVMALYGAAAFALEDAKQRQVLPLFRRGPADAAMRGYEQQLDRLEAEPGIRQQL